MANTPPVYHEAMAVVSQVWSEYLEPAEEFAKMALRLALQPAAGWLGYGLGGPADAPSIVFFMASGAAIPPLSALLEKRLQAAGQLVRMQYKAMPGFRQRTGPADGGAAAAAVAAIHPGASLRSHSDGCAGADSGRIAAILTRTGASTERWVLSNHHVLARQSACRFNGAVANPTFRIELDSGEKIGTEIAMVPMKDTGNQADACAAKVNNPASVAVDYSPFHLPEDGTVVMPKPGDVVQRLGGNVEAKVAFARATILVDVPSSGFYGAEFVDQVLLSTPGDGNRFSTDGDSGSLIVMKSTQAPVGILMGTGCKDGVEYTVVSPLGAILRNLPGGFQLLTS